MLTAFAAFGKVANQYGFFIYPDSYYYLLIAENIRDHLHPAGTLGPGGMPFPPPGYASMKTTYPAAVALALALGFGSEQAGHAVSAVCAIASVPAAYFATKRLIDSRASGLVAATLVATSYGITYWSGFIMSDSISILLAFLLLTLIAVNRPDRWANIGDLGVGAIVTLLLLSRPTYLVALPFLAWLAHRRWGWTRTRFATAAAMCAFLTTAVAAAWFPPSSFSSRILTNLLPVIAAAGLVAAGVLYLSRRAEARSASSRASRTGTTTLLVLMASTFVALWGAERVVTQAAGVSPYVGLARFALRDPAVLVGIIPGAYLLAKSRRADTGVALLGAGLTLLGVYFWAEPRESRYLIHILPLLVPVAGSTGLLYQRLMSSGVPLTSRYKNAAAWALTLGMLVFIASVGWQARDSGRPAQASFLTTAYPAEVAAGLESRVPRDATIISALPWPYYFHLRNTTWGAGVAYVDDMSAYIDDGDRLLVIEDASLRFHYGGLAKRLAAAREPSLVFGVPIAYQYGYSAVGDPKPIRAYLITGKELRAMASSEPTASTGSSAP